MLTLWQTGFLLMFCTEMLLLGMPASNCQSSTQNSGNPPSAWYYQTLPKAGFLHIGISSYHKRTPSCLSVSWTSTRCHGVLLNSYVQAISWYVPHCMKVPWALWVVKSQQFCQIPLLPFLSLQVPAPSCCFPCANRNVCAASQRIWSASGSRLKLTQWGKKRFVLDQFLDLPSFSCRYCSDFTAKSLKLCGCCITCTAVPSPGLGDPTCSGRSWLLR